MFNYPELAERLKKPTKVEQFCDKCKHWYRIPLKNLKAVLKELADKGMASFKDCKCTHCGKKTSIILPGKYDHPLARRENCSLQYYEWEEFPKVPKKITIRVELKGANKQLIKGWEADLNPHKIVDYEIERLVAVFKYHIANELKSYIHHLRDLEKKRKTKKPINKK